MIDQVAVVVMIEALAVILLDQGSKRWLYARREQQFVLGSLLTIRCVVNRNRMYQQSRSRIALAALWPVALVCATALYAGGLYFQGPFGLPGLAVAFAGSASNLADIVWSRSIVDFIDLGWWPVFNIADIAIVGGLAVALYP
jgi:signal peptidase II